MKTTVQALKELYAKLGGDLADVALIDRVPDMIEALNSIAVAVPAPTAEDEGKVMTVGDDGALGFANALPPVTSADAGKVLAVDEQGVWNPAEASGGGDFVLKSLGQKSVSGTKGPGWVAIDFDFDFQIPSDFALLGFWYNFGINSKTPPFIVNMNNIAVQNAYNKINYRGVLHYYSNDQKDPIISFSFYYYAKA